MGDHYAVLALRRKRARLAGEIEAIERAQIGRRASLTNRLLQYPPHQPFTEDRDRREVGPERHFVEREDRSARDA